MKNRLITWLKQVVTPDALSFVSKHFWKLASRHAVKCLAEDARKIGVNAIGIGLIGFVVDTTVPRNAALIVFTIGVIIWVVGLLLTSSDQ